MPKRIVIGIVTSAKQPTHRRVEVALTFHHAKYGKTLRSRTICHVHDANSESALGDTVEIEESAPISKTKRWKLLRIVEKNKGMDIQSMRASAKIKQDELASGVATTTGK
jgi:small subunit ribosomal protein S17